MVYRKMYVSFLKSELTTPLTEILVRDIRLTLQKLQSIHIFTLSLFHSGKALCVYLESSKDEQWFEWGNEVHSMMQITPGLDQSRYAIHMPEIFHDGVPNDHASWRQARVIKQRVGSLARIRPDLLARYIFYHYQLQEEYPEHFNKTYIIGLFQNMIFSYHELPAVVSESPPLGKLQTRLSPVQNWQDLMHPHFEHWHTPSGESIPWLPMNHLITFPEFLST
jgi:hypothetical protein